MFPKEVTSDLTTDQDFYEAFSLKPLQVSSELISNLYKIEGGLADVFYPWNRTFEIGLIFTQ